MDQSRFSKNRTDIFGPLIRHSAPVTYAELHRAAQAIALENLQRNFCDAERFEELKRMHPDGIPWDRLDVGMP
jgi:hypothetical protein